MLQAQGEIEAEFGILGTASALKSIFSMRKPGPLCLPKENAFEIGPDTSVTLPSWLSEKEFSFYATKFDQKGFTGGLNYYRALDLYVQNSGIMFLDLTIKNSLFIVR